MSSPHPTDNSGLRRSLLILVAVLVPALAGFFSILLGKDFNWDFQNYHYYNAYAVLENRLAYDVAPAQLQTFFNPTLDVPFYLLSRVSSAGVTGFVVGWLHGFNLLFLFLVFWQVARNQNLWLKFAAGLALVLVSGIAPGFIAELGGTMNDNLISLFILGALPALIAAGRLLERGEQGAGLKLAAAAGVLVGAAVGLKQTVAVYALSLPLALMVYSMPWRRRLKLCVVFGASGLLGCLLTAGWWWWTLWSHFGNPFLPFMNTVFKSPFVELSVLPGLLEGHRRVSSSVVEWLVWPFIMAVDSQRVSQFPFSDLRFSMLYVLSLVWLFTALWRRMRPKQTPSSGTTRHIYDRTSGGFLLLFVLFGFILWLAKFSTYRYLITLELLVPLSFVLVLERLTPSAGRTAAIITVALLLGAVFFKPYDWGRVPWGDRYVRVDTSPYLGQERRSDALVVMLGSYPTAYVIPEFPADFRFVRPEGNLQLQPKNLFKANIIELLRAHNGPLYVLYDSKEPVNVAESLARLDVLVQSLQCHSLRTEPADTLIVCEASYSLVAAPKDPEP